MRKVEDMSEEDIGYEIMKWMTVYAKNRNLRAELRRRRAELPKTCLNEKINPFGDQCLELHIAGAMVEEDMCRHCADRQAVHARLRSIGGYNGAIMKRMRYLVKDLGLFDDDHEYLKYLVK